ncbi:hypothetical protein [Bradyrhizobium sp. S3.5.5]|uniref:hypothetical protein n=1 Tax=Bradyrhizobium sp. S3.5.5 TaxID=3156430 RepID=UPI003394BCB8
MPLHTHPPVPSVDTAIDPEVWKPTRASDGLLDPPLRSRSASTGFIVEGGRLIGFASRPEKYAGEVFSLDSEIDYFVEQFPRVGYFDGASWRHHTFDYYVVRNPGIRTCVAIKHSSRVEKTGIRDTLKLIAEQAGKKTADEVVLMTEADFTKSQRFNAELVHEIRRHPVPEHDVHIRQIAAEIIGVVTIADVVKMSGLAANGFRATVRLVADRFFRLADADDRIDYDTRIRRC